MEHQNIYPLANFRSHKILHYAVVTVTASVILFLYYSYKYAIPTPPGHYMGWFWDIFYFEFRNNIIGILMNIPMLYATIALGWKRSFIVVLILLACIAPYIVNFSFSVNTLLLSFSFLIIPATIVIGAEIKVILDAEARIAEDEKKKLRAELKRQMFKVQEDERKRISKELHDGVAQTLLANASLAHNIMENNKISSDNIKPDLEAVKKNSLDMVGEIRRICQDLRPSILDNLGLVSSINWLLDRLHEETGINVKFSLKGTVYELTQDESVALFRMIQEACNNVKKHAEADSLCVAIDFSEPGIFIQIKDNGKGFELKGNINRLALSGKLGIIGMNDRAQSIGAILQIKSAKGLGTEVDISIPAENTMSSIARTQETTKFPKSYEINPSSS